jgi:ribA/ribD-fused uncharacterized protein
MIREFKDEYSWLSNFEPCQVMYDGDLYPSSEHAFVAAKTLDKGIRRRIAALPFPGQAKKYGRKIPLRPDWHQVKDQVMYEVVSDKFRRNPGLKAKLLSTGEIPLQEGNWWKDTYWGVDLKTGQGQNKLGEILMRVRSEL